QAAERGVEDDRVGLTPAADIPRRHDCGEAPVQADLADALRCLDVVRDDPDAPARGVEVIERGVDVGVDLEPPLALAFGEGLDECLDGIVAPRQAELALES